MAKRNLILLLILSFLVRSSLAAESITAKNWPKFAGVEWGSSKEAVKKILEEKGYKCLKPRTIKGKEGFVFTGVLAGKKAEGLCNFTSNKLRSISVNYRKEKVDFDAVTLGVKLNEILVKKYGEPIDISSGNDVSLGWANADNSTQLAIILLIKPGEVITILYNSLDALEALKKKTEQAKKSEEDF